jgi:hypothetical protein
MLRQLVQGALRPENGHPEQQYTNRKGALKTAMQEYHLPVTLSIATKSLPLRKP